MDGASGGVRHPFAEPPATGHATEVAEGILWLRLPLPMALDHVNVFALDDGDGWTVVDTGFSSRKTKLIWEALLAGPLAGRPVRRVLVTHHHPDHVGLAGWFQARGAELLMPRTGWLFARMLTLDVQDVATPQSLAFLRASGASEAHQARHAADRPFNFADIVDPLPVGYTRISEGQTLRLGGRDWRVRMGDGHAPEHATLWEEGGPLILGGDQLLPGISANIGVYPTEPEANPLADWLNSCRCLLPHARDDHFVLPGHKLPFNGLPFRLGQMIENHESALDRLVAHLATPRRGGDCFAPLFKRDIGPEIYGLALVETIAHLNFLHDAGRARREMGADGAWRWHSTGADHELPQRASRS